MSKKNLSRSIIEGGRNSYNKWERRNSSSVERVNERALLKKVVSDPDLDAGAVHAKRRKVYKGFDDKLSPIYRWLDSRIGKPWDEVYSEIKSKFDVRTTAGRHIVYDHLLGSVSLGEDYDGFRSYGYFVDDAGVLRYEVPPWRRHHRGTPPGKKKWPLATIYKWANDRKVIVSGSAVFWGNPLNKTWRECSDSNCVRKHTKSHKKAKVRVDPFKYIPASKLNYDDPAQFKIVTVEIRTCAVPGAYSQGKRLTAEERKFWDSILDLHQNDLIYETTAQRAERLKKEGYGSYHP